MVKSLDKIPYGTMPKWGQTARFLINTKQKMGLGVNSKNVNRRWVVIGLNNQPKNFTNQSQEITEREE